MFVCLCLSVTLFVFVLVGGVSACTSRRNVCVSVCVYAWRGRADKKRCNSNPFYQFYLVILKYVKSRKLHFNSLTAAVRCI